MTDAEVTERKRAIAQRQAEIRRRMGEIQLARLGPERVRGR
jgi:hypothetical protein